MLTVTRYAHSIEVGGASPSLTIALRGNNLSDTGVRIALPPLHGGKLVIDRAEGSWYKRQQHRIIPQDSDSCCCLDSERPGGFTPPFSQLSCIVISQTRRTYEVRRDVTRGMTRVLILRP